MARVALAFITCTWTLSYIHRYKHRVIICVCVWWEVWFLTVCVCVHLSDMYSQLFSCVNWLKYCLQLVYLQQCVMYSVTWLNSRHGLRKVCNNVNPKPKWLYYTGELTIKHYKTELTVILKLQTLYILVINNPSCASEGSSWTCI